ncbi:flagellar hook-basal body complex protein FliE [Desulfitobacterium sp. Sab5]|uniref:flagellar hook-basal body complex protein FliE n=1 Tax=Desulfitobacterium nosdiversum TaxID=3375356 RepID=UPI003CF01FC1
MAVNAIPPINSINMINPGTAVNPVQNTNANIGQTNGIGKASSDFGQFLSDALNQVDALQKTADAASIGLATGQIQDIHTVMIALQKASLSLNMTVEARNKVLDAYQEIMRMQM